jgi:hypothetical protein
MQDLDAVEFFSGEAAFSRYLRAQGKRVASAATSFSNSANMFDLLCMYPEVDVLYDPERNSMDLRSPQGFALALSLLVRLKPGGTVLMAVVCAGLCLRLPITCVGSRCSCNKVHRSPS